MKKRNIMILVLLLTIGFATVSTTLILNGTVKVSENSKDFDVYFSNSIEDGVENKKLIKDDIHLEFTKEMSLVGETYELEYDVTNGSRNYDADITINCTKTNEYVSVINEFDTTSYLKATETRRGKLTIELLKPYIGTTEKPTKDINISCEIVVTDKERESLGAGTPADKVKNNLWTITEDNNSNGELSKGDLITIGTESFYVYDIEGDNVKALAQYNLYVGNSYVIHTDTITPLENPTGLQDERAYGVSNISTVEPSPWIGVVAFNSSSSTSYEISEIKEYVDAYKTKLEELNGNIIEARLITKEELEKIGCHSNTNTCDYDMFDTFDNNNSNLISKILYGGSFWTMSADSSNQIWGFYNEAFQGTIKSTEANDNKRLGVRPVIVISKSLFE